MELKFFRLSAVNGQEYVIESQYDIVAKLGGLRDEGYVTLKRDEGSPLHIFCRNLFSVQEVNKGVIGNQTRVWRML